MQKAQRAALFLTLAAAALALGWHGLGSANASLPTPQAAPAVRIATCDTLDIVEKLVKSDRYAPARAAAFKDVDADLSNREKELQDLYGKIVQAGQNSPDAQALIPTFQAKRTDFQKMSEEVAAKKEEMNTKHVAEAYRLAVETVNSLAQSRGYTHVLSSRAGGPDLKSTNVPGALQEILARPVILGVAADDLTQDVVKELKLDAEPKTDAAATDAAPGAAPKSDSK